MTAIDAFRDAMLVAGLLPPARIQGDDEVYRCPTKAKPKKLNGAYCFDARTGTGWYRDHGGSGELKLWPLEGANGHDRETPEETAMRIEAAKAAIEKRRKDAEAAAADAERRWQKAKPAKATHPYLKKKGIGPNRARQDGDVLLIPLRDAAGKLHALQTIPPSGDPKLFGKGSATAGHFFTIGDLATTPAICIGEGFATAARVHEMTGCAAVVAFSSHNLVPVTDAIAELYPDALLILCADDDHLTTGNPGLTYAQRAASHVPYGVVAVPVFGAERADDQTDFADMVDRDAVTEIINEAIAEAQRLREAKAIGDDPVPPLSDPSPGGSPKLKKFKLIPARDIRYDPKDDHWLIDGLLPMTGLATLWGKYKSFKSFIAFAVAVALADALLKKWGDRALQHGPVVYVVAEDMDGIDARIEAYRREMKHFDDLPLFIIKARPNLGAKIGDRQELVTAISDVLRDVGPVAIFLDTLARMLGGEGENDTGMQNFVDNAEAISEAFGCLSIAVHHENAATDADPKADKPRGHTSLPGALVASWHVIKTGDGIDGPWTADIIVIGAKNSATGFALKVTLKRVDLGENRHGRMESILILDTVEWADRSDGAANAEKKRRLDPDRLKLLLRCFRNVRDGKEGTEGRQVHGDGPWMDVVKSSRVRDLFVRRFASDPPRDDDTRTPAQRERAHKDHAHKTYKRIVEGAVINGHLHAEPAPDGAETYLWEA